MKSISLVFMSFGLMFSAPALAQDAGPGDVIVVTASKQNDPAMKAFLAGDFATAEIEFEKNAFCALRTTRRFTAGVESARDSSIRADVAADAVAAPQPTGGPGAAGGITAPSTPTITPNVSVDSSGFQKSKSEDKRTCENRGYQVYMMGLSQLKLGKTADAKKTLSRATKIHRTLYDAHFRLSLLEYQDGNIEKANKQFKTLKKLAKRCRRCEAKEEITAQVKFLDKLLK